MTIGTEWLGIRITKGRLDRHGHYHPNQPCVFLLFKNKRKDFRLRLVKDKK